MNTQAEATVGALKQFCHRFARALLNFRGHRSVLGINEGQGDVIDGRAGVHLLGTPPILAEFSLS